MAKRKLAPEDVGKLQKCLEVRGASERAVHDIWNICHDKDKKITRGTFERNVEQGKEAWLAVTEAVTFSCHDGSDVALPIVDLRKYLQKMCMRGACLEIRLGDCVEPKPFLISSPFL